MRRPECRVRHFNFADTPLRVRIAIPTETVAVFGTLTAYGLLEEADALDRPDLEPHLVLLPDLDTQLAAELATLSPIEVVCCTTDLYLRDSKIVTGNPIELHLAGVDAPPWVGLETALTLHFARQGALVLHACGFRLDSTDYLALGPSGSGKSTLAIAALQAGGKLLSDDQLVCYGEVGDIHAHWLRPNLLLRQDSAQCLSPPLAGLLESVTVGGEARYRLNRQAIKGRTRNQLRPGIVFHLDSVAPNARPSDTPAIARLNQAQAFAGLLRASSPALFGDRFGTGAPLSRFTRELAARAEHYRLTTSKALLNDPAREFTHIQHRIAAMRK